MTSSDLAYATALEQAELVRLRKVSPVELVELYLRRIEELNPKLNAYLTVVADLALDDARRKEAEAGNGTAPFHGVPIAIKDLSDTAGIRTTCGTAAFADRVPDRDAEVVARLRTAGFVILGKTNTPEFGTSPWTEPVAYGPARNPWDLERTPGGSSGGAAAAVAASLCPIAHGTDGGGSVRIPASVCGLYGIKPSRGRISMAPGPQSLLSTSGPIAWSVADAAAMLDAMAGYATGDAFWAAAPAGPFAAEAGRPPGRLRVAVSSVTPNGVDVSPGSRDAVRLAAELLTELGHDVAEDAPVWPGRLPQLFATLFIVGQASKEPLPPDDALEPMNRALFEMARGWTSIDYGRAISEVGVESRRIVSFFDRYDVFVQPTVAVPPPRIGELTDPDQPLSGFARAGTFVPYTPAWNLTGQPAVTVPLHTDALGLPVGVQLVGRPEDEATLIRLSAQLEEARPWTDRRPASTS